MFVPAQGLDYRDFLATLHQKLRFDWYLEIGSQGGVSLAKSRSPSVAADPAFQFRVDVTAHKPRLHLFQETGDDFFAAGHLLALKIKPSFSFLDGMHLCEYLLRDIMNTEAAGTTTSVIALHDCCPFDHPMTTRDLDNKPRGPWTGDVWKLIPILQEYRPDLTLQVLDCAPTGLVVLSGLDPENRMLQDNYDRIVAQYRDVTLADFGTERFFGSFTYVDARQEAAAGFPAFCRASNRQHPVAKAIAPPPATPVVPAKPSGRHRSECLSANGANIYSRHEVLRDVANDLARGLTQPLSMPVDVYVGVQGVTAPPDNGRLRIGIQTEHFADANGTRMWRVPRERLIRRFAAFYDVLLDLSPQNRPAYDFLRDELRAKIRFGPHIFPDIPVEPDFKDAPPLFFGAMNDRRQTLLKKLQTDRPVAVAPRRTFGPDLQAQIAAHGSVLNLHFVDGVYTEYPRLLKAYLSGKPLVSEPLAAPLVAGTHYFDLQTQPTRAATEHVFRNLATFAAQYSFRAFLEGVLAEAQLRKAG
jgi:hypothetical protein